jgi:group II intron reverse transcriptase/maturase
MANEPALLRAWERVAIKRGGPGIDHVSIDDFARLCPGELQKLHRDILSGTFHPQPLIVFPKAKQTEGFRELTVATVRDRIAARTAADFLNYSCDRRLLPQSYAYRPGKGALKAVSAAQQASRTHAYAVRVDIDAFFDSMDRDLLDHALDSFNIGPDIRAFIMQLVASPRFNGVSTEKPDVGVPQGSPLAPVLSNLYLATLDRNLELNHIPFVRYSDDILGFAADADSANGTMACITESLSQLKLQASLHKSRVYSIEAGFPFLGFLFNRNGHTASHEARAAFSRKMDMPPCDDETESEFESRQKAIVRGWNNYYQAAKPDSPVVQTTEKPLPAIHAGEAPTFVSVPQPQPIQRQNQDRLSQAKELIQTGRPTDGLNLIRQTLNDENNPLPDANRQEAFLLLATIYEGQGLNGAATRCRQEAGIQAHGEPQPETPVFGTRDIETWMDIFGGGEGPIYRQFVDRLGRHGYKPGAEHLAPNSLKEHWEGRSTLAVPVYDQDNAVRFGVLDLDISQAKFSHSNRAEIEQARLQLKHDAIGLLDRAHQAGVEGVIEDSGCKGYHVWFFLHARLEAGLVHKFLSELSRTGGTPPEGTHREFFPGSTSQPSDRLGSRIKLPLGIHRLTRNRSRFISPNGQPCEDGVILLHNVNRNTASALRTAISRWTRFKAEGAVPVSAPATAECVASAPLSQLLEGCSIINGLEAKAKQTGWLSHAERTILRSILHPIGESGDTHIHTIISACKNYDKRVTHKELSLPPRKPISCQRIQEILGEFCNQVGCNCRFKQKTGEYAHPLRHVNGTSRTRPMPPHSGPPQPPTSPVENTLATTAEPVKPMVSPEANPAPIQGLLAEFSTARKALLAIQDRIEAQLGDQTRMTLETGTLTREDHDPALHRWIIEL